MKKSDYLEEKCTTTEDVEYIHHGTNDLEVSSTHRNWRAGLLNRKLEVLKERKLGERT